MSQTVTDAGFTFWQYEQNCAEIPPPSASSDELYAYLSKIYFDGSTHPFSVRAANDSHRYVVPRGDHGSAIYLLPEEQANEARAHLARWMDVPITPVSALDRSAPPFEPSPVTYGMRP